MAFVVNVPNAPGVPAVLRAASAVAALPSLLTSDAAGLLSSLFGFAQWGIFLGGAPVVICDNVISVDVRSQWTLASFPIEGGSFESYDKVTAPYMANVVMTAGGSQANRAAFLASIKAIQDDLNLYDVVTPEQVYVSCNIAHVDLARRAYQGAGLIAVEVSLQEIRVTASQQMSNTQDPGASSQVSGGSVQTSAPTQAQSGANFTPDYTPVPAGQTPRGGG
jgi:hypothetical protein